MSPEAQRVAIAEFCKLPPEVTWKLPSSFVAGKLIPDFPNDLNACAAMEKALNSEELTDYIRLLNNNDFSYRRLARATAAQRCEAFLKTMNLWKE